MGGSILIVEDELVTQRLIAASLEARRVQGDPGAQRSASEADPGSAPGPDVLDWILPGTTGVSFLRQLRNERRTKQSGHHADRRTEEFDKVTGLEAGAEITSTSFSHRELLRRIRHRAPPRAVARR